MRRIFHRLHDWIERILFPSPTNVARLENTDAATLARWYRRPPGTPKQIEARFAYRDPLIRQMIWEVKYRGNTRLANTLATVIADELMAEEEEQLAADDSPTHIVPIPANPRRHREHGWNQSELIAREVATCLPDGWRCSPHLLKRRERTPQTQLTRAADRRANMRHAFYVPLRMRTRVDGSSIVLIDDVSTTGATLRDARRALTEAGAKEVRMVAVAH